MKTEKSEVEISHYLMLQLEKNFPSAMKKQLQNACKRMNKIVNTLMKIPPCESAAVGIGFSVKQSSESIAKDNNLDGDILCNLIFDTVRYFSKRS